ncbi:tyrosine-type recombinase/integrase [Nonomuraea sp. NPDC049419]|uniref:tyrosine-type recombinase/integrase n=1 Tax=Nonomuraea sp. NPDC049419 TaxID=3155772 RepID=UPI003421489A
MAAGKVSQAGGFVFTDEIGRPLHPQHLSDQSDLLSYEAGLPPVRLHDLRHGAACLMSAAGVDLKIVQKTLGHVSSTSTRDTHTSVYQEVARAAAESTATLSSAVPDAGHARVTTLPARV